MTEVVLEQLKAMLGPVARDFGEYIKNHRGDIEPELKEIWNKLQGAFAALELDADVKQKRDVYETCARTIAARIGRTVEQCTACLYELAGETDARLRGEGGPADPTVLSEMQKLLVGLKANYRRDDTGTITRRIEVWTTAGQGAARTAHEEKIVWDAVPSEARAQWIRTGARETTFTVIPRET